MRFVRRANLHYQGQIFELNVPGPVGDIDRASLEALAENFGQEHERTYGHRAGPQEPVELVNLVLVGQGVPEHARVPDRLLLPADDLVRGEARQAYFGPDVGWLETTVTGRGELRSGVTGPVIVEEYDATCVVPPGASAILDDYGNIRMTL